MTSHKTTIARAVSVIGHPFATCLLLMLVSLWNRIGKFGAICAALAVVAVFIPVWLFMRNRLASGRWETIDASASRDRPALFTAAFSAGAVMFLYFSFIAKNPDIARGIAILAAMLCLAAVLNRWIKLSLHLGFAAFAGLVLLKLQPAWGVGVLVLLPLLVWSRLTLARHTAWEALGGILLGAATAGIELW